MAFVVLPPTTDKNNNVANTMATKILGWVNNRVANHKRLRGGVYVIDKIPRNAAGKLLRREAKELYNKKQKWAAKL